MLTTPTSVFFKEKLSWAGACAQLQHLFSLKETVLGWRMLTTPTSVFFIGNCPELAHAHNSNICFLSRKLSWAGACSQLPRRSACSPTIWAEQCPNDRQQVPLLFNNNLYKYSDVQRSFLPAHWRVLSPDKKLSLLIRLKWIWFFKRFHAFLNFLDSSRNFVLAM